MHSNKRGITGMEKRKREVEGWRKEVEGWSREVEGYRRGVEGWRMRGEEWRKAVGGAKQQFHQPPSPAPTKDTSVE